MKYLKSSPRLLIALATAIFSTQLHAATPIWNAAGGGNWSVNGNWTPAVIPQLGDDVQFGNVGAGNQNTVDTSFSIGSLIYNQDNGLAHTTVINPGQTVTISRTTSGDALSVGSTSGATTATTLVSATIQGAGGTLILNGTNDLVVRQGFSTAGGHQATLDMSGLDTFTATIGHLLVGQANAGASVNRPSGILLLAKTNTITANGTNAPQVMIQDGASNSGNPSTMSLGQVNNIFADNLRLGGQKGTGTVNFNPAFSLPSLLLRGTNGVNSRASLIACGDNMFANSGSSTTATVDFGLGIVDILADTVFVARGNPGPLTGTCTAALTLGAGIFDVNTINIGYQISSGANGAANGTMAVNNSGSFPTGAVLRVNTTMVLAHTNAGGTGAVVGTLNMTGGTVLANTIVAGGGNSTINMGSSATLVISNAAGTLASPIKTLNIANSTLVLPALNAGSVLAVGNLVSGGGNTITVSSLPPIGAYPVTFTLVSYQTGPGGTFTLNPLPPASPSFAGTLIDSGNGVIQLQVTAGPVANLSETWTGTANNNWDTTSVNWLFQGNPSTFFTGGAPLFNDSASTPNVNLTTLLSPSVVTINNSTLQYDLSGPGSIAGASSLTKQGSQTAIIENQGVNNFGSVTISGGTLQLGAGSTNGDLATLNITNNAALVVNRSGTPSLSSAITGSGTLTKLGNGTLTLSGASSYTGATTLSGGGLQIDGTLSGGGPVNTASGTVLSGGGTVSGSITSAGQINPGVVNGAGILTVGAGLTLSSGSTLRFDLSATDTSPGVNDAIAVTGNLTLNNNSVAANFLGVPQPGFNYPVITYSGGLSGSFNPVVTGTHFTTVLDTSSLGTVFLDVTGGTGANLKWSSTSSGVWDSITTNWTDLGLSAPSLFFSGDSVLLDDTAGVTTGLTIAPGLAVYPAAITNMSDANNFTISGAGKISGAASIVKAGASTLTISTPNDFSGTVDIQGGILKVGNATALGNITGGTLVESNATVDFGGQSVGGEIITASGPGANNAGAIINTGGAQNQAIRQIILTGDTSFGGTGMWAINNAGGAASISTGNQPFKITKVGANLVSIENVATMDPNLGNIEVQQGTLEFNGLTASMGDQLYTNIVDSGATLQFTADSVVWNKFFNFTGNGTTTTVNNNTSATTELAGPVEVHGAPVFNAAGASFTISGVISGDGSLTKTGSSPLILTANNTYTGDTLINAGALRLGGDGSISNSLNVVIASGATLTVTGRVDTTFTVLSGQTLSGSGIVAGNLTANPGSTITPGGVGTIGALTVSNAIVLGGTLSMDLNQDTHTNDLLRCNNGITYGGALSLSVIGNPLTNGASFKLFSGSGYSGSFASIVPATPGNGLAWNTNTLSTGILSVVPGAITGPTTNATITSVKTSGTNLLIHGVNNNVPNTSFHFAVLTSTNIALPLSNWTAVLTNPFNPDGTFDYTNPIVTTTPRLFIDVQAVP